MPELEDELTTVAITKSGRERLRSLASRLGMTQTAVLERAVRLAERNISDISGPFDEPELEAVTARGGRRKATR